MTLRHPELLWLLVPLALLLFVSPCADGAWRCPPPLCALPPPPLSSSLSRGRSGHMARRARAIFVMDRSGSIPAATTASQARSSPIRLTAAPDTRGGIVAFGGKAAVALPPAISRTIPRASSPASAISTLTGDTRMSPSACASPAPCSPAAAAGRSFCSVTDRKTSAMPAPRPKPPPPRACISRR